MQNTENSSTIILTFSLTTADNIEHLACRKSWAIHSED